MSHWIDYSLNESHGIDASVTPIAIAGVAWMTLILAHSAYKNKFAYRPVQVVTECATVFTLLACALVLIGTRIAFDYYTVR
jgi:hypothetical protein